MLTQHTRRTGLCPHCPSECSLCSPPQGASRGRPALALRRCPSGASRRLAIPHSMPPCLFPACRRPLVWGKDSAFGVWIRRFLSGYLGRILHRLAISSFTPSNSYPLVPCFPSFFGSKLSALDGNASSFSIDPADSRACLFSTRLRACTWPPLGRRRAHRRGCKFDSRTLAFDVV
jgi:hypothetical protein